jgi:hypothetical protein
MSAHDTAHNANGSEQLLEDGKRLVDDVQQFYTHIKEDNPVGKIYQDNPYVVLAAAAGLGYIIGGGLLTPFTRRLLRVGLKAMVIPVAANQLKSLAANAGQSLNGDESKF